MDKRAVDENFIAKTRPQRKDIQWHTDDLLNNLCILKEMYPNLSTDWELLRLACIYHDMGKMNFRFQSRVHGKGNTTGLPHGVLSLGFIDVNYLGDEGYSDKDIELLFHAVAYHHERDMNFEMDEVYNEIETFKSAFSKYNYSQLPTRYFKPKFYKCFYNKGQRYCESKDGDYFFKYIMLKGLLNRLDYAASAEIKIENPNDFLVESMDNLLVKWQTDTPETRWNDLQNYMIEQQNKNIVVVAQTGMGKTEAGLLWLGNSKGFFTLPLKSAINAIYKRIIEKIVTEKIEERVALLHSDTLKVYSEHSEGENDIDFETYYARTRQLSLPLTVCTLDQIFDFVYRYKGFEPKLATLSYSKVIIDEIQMYSHELVAYLVLGLKYITQMGGKFAIMTATLPQLILNLLEEEGIQFEKPQVFTNSLIRHSLKRIEAAINDNESVEQISKAYNKNKLLVICNTIKMAKEVYTKLKGLLPENCKKDIHLLHSGFIRCHRADKEDNIMRTGSKESDEAGIWVTTQLVEASLDIDFDLIFTELSDLNGLFQRMGRCYRHRPLDVDYNCFVFTGGSRKCSGVGKDSVIDPQVHILSKEALNKDGVLSEDDKIKMIDNVYTTEKLESYYSEIKGIIEYIKSIPEYELSKQEVNEKFRNIDQILVIPLRIYKENEESIQNEISILNDKSQLLKTKIKARERLRDLMVPVNSRLAEKTKSFKLKINRAEEIMVVDADYIDEMGISFENTQKQEFRDVESRMF